MVEDTGLPLEEIEAEFGADISQLVDSVTNSQAGFKSKEERQAENLRKMFVNMARDIQVLLIKLTEPITCTLKYLSSIKQQAISRETEIYLLWRIVWGL